MKIVLDLQAAQSESRLRGIGRYSLSLAQALIRNAGQHDVYVALNHVFEDTVEPLRETLRPVLPEQHILIYRTLPQTYSRDPANHWRNSTSQLIRESFLASLEADVVHTSSMFEGWGDDCVVSCGRLPRDYISAVTLYDLIPYARPERYLPTDAHQAWYSDLLDSLRNNDLLLAISDYSRRSALDLLGTAESDVSTIFADADPMFAAVDVTTPGSQQRLRELGIDTPFIMYTGIISRNDPRKNCPGLIEAYARLSPQLREQHQLVLVGHYNAYDHHDMVVEAKRLGVEAVQLVFTDRVNDEDLVLLYSACHLFVFPSLEEGFGLPALEAMRCGTVAIGSNSSSIPEVIGNPAALFDPLSCEDMAQTMERVLSDEALRGELYESSQSQAARFCWDRSAGLALEAFERKYQELHGGGLAVPQARLDRDSREEQLHEALVQTSSGRVDPRDLVYCAQAMAENWPCKKRPTLYLDVSVLIEVDAQTGIQRVVRSLLAEFTGTLTADLDVQPVYLDALGGFRVAGYDRDRPSILWRGEQDQLIDVAGGDIYLALDLDMLGTLVDARNAFLRYHRQRGLKAYYIVYDLLPILQSSQFDDNIQRLYPLWLNYIASQADGLIGISRSVVDELRSWLEANRPSRAGSLQLGYFHLGADIDSSLPTTGLPDTADAVLRQLRERPSLLMVGTIEPRKGQQQALQAMELLWQEGIGVNLVLVGKSGWNMDKFEQRLESHPQMNKQLFWLQGISDEMLEQVYSTSAVLLAASTGEGFGLPLIEAARHGLAIMARDLPVFREVAGEHASYFSGQTPEELADAIRQWLENYRRGEVVLSEGMSWLSWKDSAQQLKAMVLGQADWYGSWRPTATSDGAAINE